MVQQYTLQKKSKIKNNFGNKTSLRSSETTKLPAGAINMIIFFSSFQKLPKTREGMDALRQKFMEERQRKQESEDN